jgi:ABC-2 type transport system ATP-binding protein
MKQRLAIARSLINHPRLLIMDEPLSGLDPDSLRATKELIKQLTQSQDVTVLLSSHSLADVEELCSKVAILNRGRLVAYDTVSNLRQSKEASFIRIRLAQGQCRASADKALASTEGVTGHSWVAEDTVQVAVAHGVQPSAILRRLALGSIEFREVREIGNTLEEVFLSAIGEEEQANHR